MFNFSANNLSLLSRTECRSCVVFLMKDHHTQRVYRLYDFTKSQIITPDERYCISGKVNSVYQKLHEFSGMDLIKHVSLCAVLPWK